jgi:hypothetical protein
LSLPLPLSLSLPLSRYAAILPAAKNLIHSTDSQPHPGAPPTASTPPVAAIFSCKKKDDAIKNRAALFHPAITVLRFRRST